MKHSILTLAISSLLAGSTAHADVFTADSTVISLPAFVVEATRIDLPTADLPLSLDATVHAATNIAARSSDRALDRLKGRLSGNQHRLARHHQGNPRPRA